MDLLTYLLADIFLGVDSIIVLCALKFEADRRSFMIAINSVGTYLSPAERQSLCPCLGRLYPLAHAVLANAKDYEHIKLVAKHFVVRTRLDAQYSDDTVSQPQWLK